VFFLQLGVLLVAARALGWVAEKCRLPAIVGELSAGILLSPSLLGQLSPALSSWLLPQDGEQRHLLDATALLGVVLLVALTAMQLEMDTLRRNRLAIANVSIAALVVPLTLGVAAAFALPSSVVTGGTDPLLFALFLGVAISVSAIPVAAKTLSDMGLLHRDFAQLILAAATVDDTVGWILLSMISAIAATPESASAVAISVLWVGTAAVVTVICRRIVAGATRDLGQRKSTRKPSPAGGPGALTTSCFTAIVLAAALTTFLGLEPILGAFAAGIVLSGLAPAQRAALAPLQVVVHRIFAPIYFVNAGLHTDLKALARPDVLIAAALVLCVAVVSKFLGAYIGAKVSRLSNAEAVVLGAGLNSRGVVEIVIATVGLNIGVLNIEAYTIIVVVAVVTSVMAPPIIRAGARRIPPTADEHRRNLTMPQSEIV
jgi:Kef-type K+ transport system membrane component KefB